jgi:hypothetical protein
VSGAGAAAGTREGAVSGRRCRRERAALWEGAGGARDAAAAAGSGTR